MSISFQKTHDLVRLLDLVPSAPGLKGLRDSMAILSSYAVEFRYPGEEASREVAREAIVLCRAIRISMDGRGRALDNVFIERLWRSLKYENIYPSDYRDGHALHGGLQSYFRFYNAQRPHQALAYKTPSVVYRASLQSANSNTLVSPMGERKGGEKHIELPSQYCTLSLP